MILLKLRTKPFLLNGAAMEVAGKSAPSSSIDARGKLLRKKDGVAYFLFELLGVAVSSSRLRFKGVPANASRKKRLLDDCGVLSTPKQIEEVDVGLLGVPATSCVAFAESLRDGVPERRSKIPKT
jgi:hypothetical protein